jgi:hypothetical protein
MVALLTILARWTSPFSVGVGAAPTRARIENVAERIKSFIFEVSGFLTLEQCGMKLFRDLSHTEDPYLRGVH